MSQRYIGRIATVPTDDGYAFIGIGTVTKEDGSPHGLLTRDDIFLHKDDSAQALKAGMTVVFDVIPDSKRGSGKYRAVGAVELKEAEMLPLGQPIPGFSVALTPITTRNGVLMPSGRLPVHMGMKPVPENTVEKVLANNPMPDVSREDVVPNDDEKKREMLRWFLALLFPAMGGFGTDYQIFEESDSLFTAKVNESVASYRELGLESEIPVLQEQVKRFKDMRGALKLILEDNLVRPDTIIPIKRLPDLFVAVPVWFYWVKQNEKGQINADWQNNDPSIHPAIRYFCDLFPNQRWANTFQLFNRRVRTLQQYDGELIPPHIARRMRRAVDLFDYVVIATPYHDRAGKDWQDIQWLRSIDPYLLGFKKGVPFFFVLARFSDAGTFPLYLELVADTMEFLKTNKDKLSGFNQITSPYWYHGRSGPYSAGMQFGEKLKQHVEQLQAAFEAGNLFDWLRGEAPQLNGSNGNKNRR